MDETWTEETAEVERPEARPHAGGDLLGGRYRLEALLGRGGMGTVYRAWDTWLDEAVAVKVLHRDTARFRAALVREVKLARRISHPSVLRVHDLGRDGDRTFLVMELVEGRSLGHDLADHGPLGVAATLEVARAVAAALAAAHAAGVVHCDLKPDNVLVCGDGRIVLGDFGIARALGESSAVVEGTPAYMAPEQRERRGLDARTDLYAFGQLLVTLLTGAPARLGDRLAAGPIVDVPLPAALDGLIRACLQSATLNRFTSVEELLPVLDLEVPPDPVQRRPAPLRPSGALVLAVAPVEDPVLAGAVEEVADRLRRVRGLAVRPGEVGDAVLRVAPGASGEVVLTLVDAAGSRLWSATESAEHARSAVFAAAVAGAVARALHRSPPRPARADPERDGFELYLQARHALRAGWATDVSRASSLLEAAAAKLPDDPRIQATRLLARVRTLFFSPDRDPAVHDRVRAEAEALLARAGDRVDAWEAAARAALGACAGDVAASHVARGLRRFPGSPQLHGLAAVLFGEAGDLERALHHVEQARWLDPDDEALLSDFAHLLAMGGRIDEALALLAGQTHGADTRALQEARLALWAGRVHREIPIGHLASPIREMVELTVRLAGGGAITAEERGFGERLVASAGSPRFASAVGQRIVEVLAVAGEPAAALGVLARTVDAGLFDLAWWDRCPVLAGLRADPRTGPLRARVAERAAAVLAALDAGSAADTAA